MRAFYLGWPICQTPSGIFDARARVVGTESTPDAGVLPWLGNSADTVCQIRAMGGCWSIRQLNRQVGSQFCERTALSKRTVKAKKADGG
jgi:hypothetical protein